MSVRILFLSLFLFAFNATAQPYPAKPIRIIVGGPLGGPSDFPARGISFFLGPRFNQTFVVENKAGANGILGAEACSHAAPDGYTLCLLNSTVISLNPFWYRKLPYEPRDFVPIAHMGITKAAWVAHSSVPANSVQELVALAKGKPGGFTWGTFGPASNSHLFLEWLKRTRGIDFLNVPYKTNNQALTALTNGEVLVAFGAVGTVAELARSGRIKILGIAGAERTNQWPEAPTFKEAGLDYDSGTWAALFAPPGTPATIAQLLNTETSKLFDNPQFVTKFLGAVGFEPGNIGGKGIPELVRFFRAHRERAALLAKELGIQPE
ncbi:MAG: Bug family tripartite tricarboxylate transporter substrate binding protein [Burkholderiales bacterium]